MSADGYTVCPKCFKEKSSRLKSIVLELRPLLQNGDPCHETAEYILELRSKIETIRASLREYTLEEYYDRPRILVANQQSYFGLTYSASCSVCGFCFNRTIQEEIEV